MRDVDRGPLLDEATPAQSPVDLSVCGLDLVEGEACLEPDATAVSARQRSREDLVRLARRSEAAERLAHLGSWEWDTVTDTCHFSAEWQRIHGLRRSRLTLLDAMRFCHPADVFIVREAIERMRRTLEPVHFEHRIRRADTGEVRHLSVNGYPTLDESGEIRHVYGASLDVTDQVESERRLREYQRRLQRTLAGVVGALTRTMQIRDPYTAGHQERVAELSMAIAQSLAWPEERVAGVHLAAALHDIGKLMVPAEILAKPSLLSETEFAIVRGHPVAAAEILDSVELDEAVHAAILQHHERLDGSGYPRGLSGEEITPEARLLAVADVYEAMVSHRPYRPALPPGEAVRELQAGAGIRYDQQAVGACLQLIEGGFKFSTTPQ
jgi:PAS domain S-box-containing protein/putative nucleotidyltransferase with HDIG domain